MLNKSLMNPGDITLVPESHPRRLFREAFAKAKSEFTPVKKTHSNPYFDSTYADLSDIHEAVDKALLANGFTLHHIFFTDQGANHILTKLCHQDGHEETSSLILKTKDDNDPQKLKSAATYYRRIQLEAILGIATEDDDGNGALGVGKDDGKDGALEREDLARGKKEDAELGKGNHRSDQVKRGSAPSLFRFTFGKWGPNGDENKGNPQGLSFDEIIDPKQLASYIEFLKRPNSKKSKEENEKNFERNEERIFKPYEAWLKSKQTDEEPPAMTDTDLSKLPF